MFHFLVSQAGALIQYMFILRPAQGYLRRMIFMEFIESSHAWYDTQGWEAGEILINSIFVLQNWQDNSHVLCVKPRR